MGEIMYLVIGSFILMFIGLFWDVISNWFKSLWVNKKLGKTEKTIISYTNNAGDVYYEVTLNGYKTGIKWTQYEDAEFYYNHISKLPTIDWVYKYSTMSNSSPYYAVYLDKCKIYVIPENERECHYISHIRHFDKYAYHIDKYKSERTFKSVYENIINKDFYNETVVLSSEKITEEFEEAIDSNDIDKLKRIVNEYKETVEMQNAMTNMLIKVCEADKKYKDGKYNK